MEQWESAVAKAPWDSGIAQQVEHYRILTYDKKACQYVDHNIKHSSKEKASAQKMDYIV